MGVDVGMAGVVEVRGGSRMGGEEGGEEHGRHWLRFSV
jgi:hypothetical protein